MTDKSLSELHQWQQHALLAKGLKNMGTKLTKQLIVRAPQMSVAHAAFFFVCLRTPSSTPALLLSSSLITTSEQYNHQNQFNVKQKHGRNSEHLCHSWHENSKRQMGQDLRG
jgi:hypothetical protein